MMKYIKNIAPTLIILLSVYLNVQVALAQTQTVSLGQRYAVNGKVVENPWGGVSRQLTGWETLMVLYGGYTFNTGGPTAAQITESSCPNGSALVGFNLYNMGSNYSTSGSLYCRPVTFSSTLPSFDFSLTNGGNKTVVAGTDVINSINSTLLSGNPKDVNLSVVSITNSSNQSVMNVANGIFVPTSNSFSSPTIRTGGTSELTLNTQSSTPVGTYTVTVRGVSLGTSNTSSGVIIPCLSFRDDTFPSTPVYQITCSGYMPGNSTVSELLTQNESQLYAAATSAGGVQSSINGMLNRLCDDGDDGLRNSSDSVKYVGGSIPNNYPNLELYTPVRTNITWGVTSYAACGKTITSSPINYQIASVPGNEYEIRLISGGSGSTGGVTKTTSFNVNVVSNPYNLAVTNSPDSCFPSELSQTATWSAYPGATSYNVYRKMGSTVLSIVSTTSLMHIEKPTLTGRIYEYQVAAVIAGVEQPRSALVSLPGPSLITNCPSPSPTGGGGGGGGTLVASCSVSPTSIIAGRNTTVTITGTASGGSGYQYSFDQGRSFSSNNVKQVTTSTGGEYTMIVRSTGNADTPAISCGTVTVKSLNLWLGRRLNTTLTNGGVKSLTAKRGEIVYVNSAGSGLTGCNTEGTAWGPGITNTLDIDNNVVNTSTIGRKILGVNCTNGGNPVTDSVIVDVITGSIEER